MFIVSVQFSITNGKQLLVDVGDDRAANRVLPFNQDILLGVDKEMTTDHIQIFVPVFPVFNHKTTHRSQLEARTTLIDGILLYDPSVIRLDICLSLEISDHHTVSNCSRVGTVVILNFIFNTVHKFIGSIEKLCNISSVVLDECERTTWVEMFKIVNFEDLIVKHNKFLFFVENSFLKSFNRHLWLFWQKYLFI
jgi:hypothetical protein